MTVVEVSFRWSSGYDFRLTPSFRERSPVRPRAETFLVADDYMIYWMKKM